MGSASGHPGGVAAEILTRLVRAHNDQLAVEITLRRDRPFREFVGVAEVDERQQWVDLYVAGPFGDELRQRVALGDIAHVELTSHRWC
jgi:hypothetical protein